MRFCLACVVRIPFCVSVFMSGFASPSLYIIAYLSIYLSTYTAANCASASQRPSHPATHISIRRCVCSSVHQSLTSANLSFFCFIFFLYRSLTLVLLCSCFPHSLQIRQNMLFGKVCPSGLPSALDSGTPESVRPAPGLLLLQALF